MVPHHSSFSSFIPNLPLTPIPALLCSDGGMVQSQDDSIVGTKQCRHSVAIMPIPGNLSSSSPDLLQPATSVLDFSNPAGRKTHQKENVNLEMIHLYLCVGLGNIFYTVFIKIDLKVLLF